MEAENSDGITRRQLITTVAIGGAALAAGAVGGAALGNSGHTGARGIGVAKIARVGWAVRTTGKNRH